MVWKPAVTVAAIIERDGRFLFVEEEAVEGARVLNQPAGHWEPGETLAEASSREALEESRCRFRPRYLVGVYRWHSEAAGETYLRFAFAGDIEGFDEGRALDTGILGTLWLSADQLRARAGEQGLRSPLVLRCVEDYLAGRRYPLELVEDVP
jgi:ADP-ribose pyrophosphatase YjhB (NUDIX family)